MKCEQHIHISKLWPHSTGWKLLVVDYNYFIYRKWKKTWIHNCFLSGNQHNMIQTFSDFPTNIISLMFGWMVRHFQKNNTKITFVHIPSWPYFEKTNVRWMQIEQPYFSSLPQHLQVFIEHMLVCLEKWIFPYCCHTRNCNSFLFPTSFFHKKSSFFIKSLLCPVVLL